MQRKFWKELTNGFAGDFGSSCGRQWKRNWTRRNRLMAAGLTEQRAVESAFKGRRPWWNSGASHMNQAFPKRYFQRQQLISLLEKLLDYKTTVTIRTAVDRSVYTVVSEDGETRKFRRLLD